MHLPPPQIQSGGFAIFGLQLHTVLEVQSSRSYPAPSPKAVPLLHDTGVQLLLTFAHLECRLAVLAPPTTSRQKRPMAAEVAV